MISAHAPETPESVWTEWVAHPAALVPIAVGLIWFAWGTRSPGGRESRRSAAFYGGMAVLAVALVSPLDALSETLFSAHMVQHLLLVLVAAPLLAMASPGITMLRAVAPSLRRKLSIGMRRLRGFPRGPLVALGAHAVTMWFWHLPAVYSAAVRDDLVHALEHATFIGTAYWFWAAIVTSTRRRSPSCPVRILAVFGNALQGGALGVLLLFASRPLYDVHASGAAAWGLTPLADQQLAGVLMWVPPGALQLVVMTVLFARWLGRMEARLRAGEVTRHA